MRAEPQGERGLRDVLVERLLNGHQGQALLDPESERFRFDVGVNGASHGLEDYVIIKWHTVNGERVSGEIVDAVTECYGGDLAGGGATDPQRPEAGPGPTREDCLAMAAEAAVSWLMDATLAGGYVKTARAGAKIAEEGMRTAEAFYKAGMWHTGGEAALNTARGATMNAAKVMAEDTGKSFITRSGALSFARDGSLGTLARAVPFIGSALLTADAVQCFASLNK